MSVNTLSTVPSADIDLTNTQSIVAAVIFPSIIRGLRKAAVKLSNICFITSKAFIFAAEDGSSKVMLLSSSTVFTSSSPSKERPSFISLMSLS